MAETTTRRKVTPGSYFDRQAKSIDKFCKNKTKDQQIKWLKEELADSRTVSRMTLDYWGKTMKDWTFHNKITLIHYMTAFLLGICWGILFFA